jgi:hypothetical protein
MNKIPSQAFAGAVMAATLFLTPDRAASQTQPMVVVTLEVKSGLPNPGWTITSPDEITKIRSLSSGLSGIAPVDAPIFGAFLLRSNEGTTGLPQTILLYNGVIETHSANGTSQFLQDTKGLGPLIASDGQAHGVCVNSNRSPTVIVGGCDSGVTNSQTAGPNGYCTISDEISICAAGATNHGKFVSCVSQLTNGLVKSGTISGSDKGKIQSCAAQSTSP